MNYSQLKVYIYIYIYIYNKRDTRDHLTWCNYYSRQCNTIRLRGIHLQHMRANKQEIWQRKLANWPTLWGIKHNKNGTRPVNSHCVGSSRPSESLAAEVRTTDRQGFPWRREIRGETSFGCWKDKNWVIKLNNFYPPGSNNFWFGTLFLILQWI